MAKRKGRKVKLASLIIVGEGPHDKAFLNHMKRLYDGDTGQTVKVDSADGGSPADIIKTTDRKYKHAAYDRRYILMDSDVTIRQQDRDRARKLKIQLVISEPICLEGMLLEVLGQKAPDNNDSCKAKLHPQLCGPPTNHNSYSECFPKLVLDKTNKEQIVTLRQIIANK
ncbi:hypothetical protein [Alkalimarinus coralli]|uniref:hypothetical protein n=1 Tax=Alkalimarinus coralli TaxID=2935863 RepID=UPI00202AC731|nr:hypothetical protein [Alkalimarinus coralli]